MIKTKKILTNEVIKNLSNYYNEDEIRIITSQVEQIVQIINNNKELYVSQEYYKIAINAVLEKIIEGSFLLKGEI